MKFGNKKYSIYKLIQQILKEVIMMKKNNSNNKTVGQISIDEYIETLTNTTTTDNSQEITTNQKEN